MTDDAVLSAPVGGSLVGWDVVDGQEVRVGEHLGAIEAMKMETPLLAHRAGRIQLTATPGRQFPEGAELARIG